MIKKVFLLIALIIFSTGCHSLTLNARFKIANHNAQLHQIYINEDGNLLDPFNHTVVKDVETYVNNIFHNFNYEYTKKPNLQMTIFIHGGLNDFTDATKRVTKLKRMMLEDNCYPIFISWDSSLAPNYKDHLLFIRRGVRRSWLGPISSPIILAEDLVRSVIRVPISTYNAFTVSSVSKSITSNEKAFSKKRIEELLKLKFKVKQNEPISNFTADDWWTIGNPVKLFTAPFIDGFGTGPWNSMLRRTDLVLRKDSISNGDSSKKSTAASFFLAKWQKDYRDYKTILVAHSMGTIIANNIISKYKDINFSEIIYMAAACRIKDLEYVIAPYLKSSTKTQFYNLCLSPYLDISENVAYDLTPRGSLLMWIDQTFGDINSFQDRTAGYWFNIIQSAEQIFDPTIRDRVTLTRFGMKNKSPQKHGEFGNSKFWLKVFWTGTPSPINQDLSKLNLDLSGELLSKINLTDQDLRELKLANADLSYALLTDSNLSKVNLKKANLTNANLEGALLINSNLNNANLSIANLNEANLTNANLEKAILRSSGLFRTNLSNTNLKRTNLTDANLSEANLSEANLTGANLSEANLTGANLNKINLSEANLTNAILNRANLSGVNLTTTNLTGTKLYYATLNKVNLSDTDLRGKFVTDGTYLKQANLSGTDLRKASLVEANLNEANLSYSNLSKADLSEAVLKKANLKKSILKKADLSFTDLSDANLSNANLSNVDLDEANLTGANLTGANLTGANLTGANLTGANLTGANLTGANLTGANLTGANFEIKYSFTRDGKYSSTTIWPKGFEIKRFKRWIQIDKDSSK